MAAEERKTLPRNESDKAPQRITHRERAKRRRQIATAVKREKLTTQQAARNFEVSEDYVRMACAEHGVRAQPAPSTKVGTLEILADLAEGQPATRIAADRNISRQRVNQVKQDADRLGLLPKLRRIDAELAKLRAKVSEREAILARRHVELVPQIAADADRANKAFAACLKYHRLAAGLVQADAAALAGISRETWYGYETGYRENPPLERIVSMAAALGITVVDLFRDLPAPRAAKSKPMRIKNDSLGSSGNSEVS